MQPHGQQRHSRDSQRLQDGGVEGGSGQRAVVNGAKESTQQSFNSAPTPRFSPAATGTATAPPLSAASLIASSSSVLDSALPVLRCGVIGSGRNASRLISLLAATRGCRVVSVLSRNDYRSAALRTQHPSITTVQTDLAAFLSHSEVDAVFIASAAGSVRYGSHHTLALACAERGKPTVVDRPFARSATEAREMQIAFERAQIPLLAHQPLRAMPAINTLAQSIGALQRVTSISYSFSSPLSSLTASSASSSSHCLPCLPSDLVSSGGPTLPFACDLFDVLECVLGAVSDVNGNAVHLATATPPAASSVSSPHSSSCEVVLSCSFRCGTALGAAVWDLASTSHDDRLVLRGIGGDLTLPLYQPTMPILQTAAAMKQLEAPHAGAAASSGDGHSNEPVERIVDELRRHNAAGNKSTGSAVRVRAPSASAPTDGGGSVAHGSTAADVCLVSASMSVRSLSCADAALRSFYRCRTDAYWDRPHTWQSHAWSRNYLPRESL